MPEENNSNPHPLEDLVRSLYTDLHHIAVRHLRMERPDHTLQATALINEAYLKLSDDSVRRFNDKIHFKAVASRVMRQVLVDYARARGSQKRGGGKRANMEENELVNLQLTGEQGIDPMDILALNRALDSLAQQDNSLAQLIEMRYFGGMTAEESADVLDQSPHVVRHDLRLAQAWLRRELSK